MNRFDNEDKIISQFQEVNDNEVMFATQSETIEAVYSSIHTEALWKNWINSSGKSDPPPDYYLPKDELMMDVMRVDDHAFNICSPLISSQGVVIIAAFAFSSCICFTQSSNCASDAFWVLLKTTVVAYSI